MCFAIPYQVKSVGADGITLVFRKRKRKLQKTLVKIKPGDFVLIQQGVIIRKMPAKEAREILKLLKQ